jgi:hypothetical protein
MSYNFEKDLLKEAIEQFGDITPCEGRTFSECITRFGNSYLFWFNTSDNSTRIIKRMIPDVAIERSHQLVSA